MIRIAIIEDDENIIKKIKELLRKIANRNNWYIVIDVLRKKKFSLKKNKHYDGIFLRIASENKNLEDFDIVKKVRRYLVKEQFVFYSEFFETQVVLEAYHYQPAFLINIPFDQNELNKILKAIKESKHERKIIVKDNNALYIMASEDILYLDLDKRIIYIQGNRYIIDERLDEIVKALLKQSFILYRNRYLLNPEWKHIDDQIINVL